MIMLIGFVLGLIAGLLLKRRLRPLLFERVRALPLVFVMLAACLLPTLLNATRPDLLWTEDRALLLSLLALPFLIALLVILLNCLPENRLEVRRPPVRWYHRTALLITAAGLLAEAAVLLLNHGYMPIPESYLADITDPVTLEAIRNQALLLKRLIGPDTLLPWLGQIWRFDMLSALRLSAFPYLSPGEAVIAAGLFLTGLSQFFGDRDITAG